MLVKHDLYAFSFTWIYDFGDETSNSVIDMAVIGMILRDDSSERLYERRSDHGCHASTPKYKSEETVHVRSQPERSKLQCTYSSEVS